MNGATYETLETERRETVVWITFNRPQRLNAINHRFATELADVLADLRDDRSVRVIVLRGAGRAFCAGLDIKEHETSPPHDSVSRLPEIVLAMRSCPQPIIALIHGATTGGGFAFALAADVRIAGETAQFSAGFVNLGLSGCELGTSYFLPRHVGTSVAAELLLTGRVLSAERALNHGLVSEVVPDDALEAAAHALVADMLQVSPEGLRTTKATMRQTQAVDDLGDVIELEAHGQARCAEGPNVSEAIQAFSEKRQPVYADPHLDPDADEVDA